MEVFATELKNVLNGKNIVLYSCSEFGSKFLRKNIKSLSFKLKNSNENNTLPNANSENIITSHNFTNLTDKNALHTNDSFANSYLYGKKYDIVIGGVTQHTGIITHDNVFPICDVPLEIATKTAINIIIYDVKLPNPADYKFCAFLTLSTKQFDQNDQNIYFINWPPFNTVSHNVNEQNKLVFFAGLAASTHSNYRFPQNFLNENASINYINGLKELSINYFDNNNNMKGYSELFHDEYSHSRSLAILPNYDIITEDIISTNYDVDTNDVYFVIPACDAISNFEILCDNSIVLIRSIKLRYFNGNINFEKSIFGYKCVFSTNTEHFVVINNPESIVVINCEYVNKTNGVNIGLKYKRHLYDVKLRRYNSVVVNNLLLDKSTSLVILQNLNDLNKNNLI